MYEVHRILLIPCMRFLLYNLITRVIVIITPTTVGETKKMQISLNQNFVLRARQF